MLARIVQVAIGLVAVGGLVWLAFAASFRTKFQPVQNAIRRMNRRVVNPLQLRTAGKPDAYASVVNHVGRSSGTRYRTPVVAVADGSDLVIALPYGPGADWVRNVMAAGSATIEHEGRTVAVRQPALVGPADVDQLFAPKEQRMQRRFGVDEFLRLHT